MKLHKKLLTIIFLIAPLIFYSQAESIFNGIKLNESLEGVAKKLGEISKTVDTLSIDRPSFPLAKAKEEHLICSIVKTDNGIINKVVFTFADNKLKYIEARGNVQKVFVNKRIDTARVYLDYDVYVEDGLFLKNNKNIARILTQEAIHTNLFAWENPYLNSGYKDEIKPNDSNQIPAFLKIGASIDELKPLLDAKSEFTNTEKLDGSDPNAQIQINCFGISYLGFPRKIEARFGDNKLNVVWILTGKGEEDRIRNALINQYGDPIFVNKDWEIFNNWQIGLRKDKPEVLLIEKNIGLEYKTSYFKQ
ncbi:hypothetical protein [uncultured Aquimarina sp.]|uniref:hypothetical protein n=1 Tax=uncultured Aquimarina sp. TaxID=575652 RepID=UPI002634B42E|nr:hypothetical protein [uncultured Aquimarina sp.]